MPAAGEIAKQQVLVVQVETVWASREAQFFTGCGLSNGGRNPTWSKVASTNRSQQWRRDCNFCPLPAPRPHAPVRNRNDTQHQSERGRRTNGHRDRLRSVLKKSADPMYDADEQHKDDEPEPEVGKCASFSRWCRLRIEAIARLSTRNKRVDRFRIELSGWRCTIRVRRWPHAWPLHGVVAPNAWRQSDSVEVVVVVNRRRLRPLLDLGRNRSLTPMRLLTLKGDPSSVWHLSDGDPSIAVPAFPPIRHLPTTPLRTGTGSALRASYRPSLDTTQTGWKMRELWRHRKAAAHLRSALSCEGSALRYS